MGMKEVNTDDLTANVPATCYTCGGEGVDTSAHHSSMWGLCVHCGTKVSVN